MLIFIIWCIAAAGIVRFVLFDDYAGMAEGFFGWFFGIIFSLFGAGLIRR